MADKDQEKKVNNNTNNSATNNDYEVAQESYSFWGAVWRRFRFVFIIFEEDVANFYMYKINQAIKQDPGLKEYLGKSK